MFEVREYKIEDYERVRRIIKDNFDDDKVKDISSPVSKEYVCTLDGLVVGYYVLTRIKNLVRGFDYYLVDYVCTDVDYQGMGVASRMMEHLLSLVDKDIAYVQLTCSNKRGCAKHLYEKYGFEVYDTNVFRRYSV